MSHVWRTMNRFTIIVAMVVAIFMASAARAETSSPSLAILPGDITLTGAQSRQRLLVQRVADGAYTQQLTDGVRFSSSDTSVAAVVDGVVTPKSNGKAIITAKAGGQSAAVRVRVSGMNEPHAWSFRNHVLSVLAKAGCNSGACHGALAGKGGFKLSLRGYDPLSDYRAITQQARGRRIELADPGRSLFLAKPSGAIRHKGGLRFDVDSLEYRVIAEWIAGGARPPRADEPVVRRLEIFPAEVSLRPGDGQQLIVQAHFSDGHTEDVTRWVKFASTNDAVAKTDDDGLVSVSGHGQGAVTAWYASQLVVARVTSPYENDLASDVFDRAPRRNFIDNLTLDRLRRLRIPPSPTASDSEFLRRAYLDTIGSLPTVAEARSFLADASPAKRDKLIESLLSSPRFDDYWTYKWSDVLLINGQKLRPKAVKSYYDWIHKNVAANTPWDVFVREIITATGSSYENGATNFYALHQDPENMSENVCKAFLGLSIGCAKCHNHPLEKWTNNQYYGMANLFSRVRAKGWGGDFRNGDGLRTLYVVDEGELIQPLTGKPQQPRPLDGRAIAFDSAQDRRGPLAAWLTAPENPYFSRSIANRVWANFFGVGIVEPVDDLRVSNPASNDALLDAVAEHLVSNQFDLKSLMRSILQSATYQRGSRPLPGNKDESRFYSRYYPRRMMAEVLLDAISQVTGVASDFTEVAFPGADKKKTDFYPKGTRALQLYDSAVDSYFLKTFGRNQRQITCECDRSNEPSMVQVLHLANGDTINKKLQAKDGRVSALLASEAPDARIVEEAYLLALARLPRGDETQRILRVFAESKDVPRRALVEDLFWGLLSSREFLFHH